MAQPFRCGTLEVPAKPQQRGTTVDHATTLRSAYERINAGDMMGSVSCSHRNSSSTNEVPGLPPTKEGVLAYFGSLLTAFPDMRMDVEDLIASENKAVARVKAMATHQGEFMGYRPPARPWRSSSSTS
jgi:predicted ester cyclase